MCIVLAVLGFTDSFKDSDPLSVSGLQRREIQDWLETRGWMRAVGQKDNLSIKADHDNDEKTTFPVKWGSIVGVNNCGNSNKSWLIFPTRMAQINEIVFFHKKDKDKKASTFPARVSPGCSQPAFQLPQCSPGWKKIISWVVLIFHSENGISKENNTAF